MFSEDYKPDKSYPLDVGDMTVPEITKEGVKRTVALLEVNHSLKIMKSIIRLSISKIYSVISFPFSVFFILNSEKIHKAYRMSFFRKLWLGWRMMRNARRILTATTYKVHLAMALKLLELSPEIKGDVIECGTWKGGSAANLSLICKIVGRRLFIYDSFEGLPEAAPHDREAVGYAKGDYAGSLEEVRENIRRYGAIEQCTFVKGWFNNTLPQLKNKIALAFLDVDIEASLDVCVRYIWPQLVDGGYVFTDESTGLNYVALFFSEKWWQKYFHSAPPGLMGAGTGLPLGTYYIGPLAETKDHFFQRPSSGGYTRKGWSSVFTYYPDEL